MNGQFVAFWGCNVNKDLGVDPAKSPRYMIVSGNADLRRVGGAQSGPSRGIIYVAEITSGKVAAYAIPWSPPMYAANQVQNGSLYMVAATQFRQTGVGPVLAPAERKAGNGKKSNSMQITVNGQSREVAAGATVAGLLDELRLTGKPVAVEVNLELVPRQRHAEHRLAEGDRLEIVTLVGGG